MFTPESRLRLREDLIAAARADPRITGAVHHLDVYRGTTLFRVFLLASTLQVDVAFWAPDEFGAFSAATDLLAAEVEHVDTGLARRLVPALDRLRSS